MKAVVAGAAAFALSSTAALADNLTLLGTGAVRRAVITLAEAFHEQTGHTVSARFGTAGVVDARVEAGEAIDVAISSANGMKSLAAKGKLASEPIPVGSVRIGVGVCGEGSNPDFSSLEAMKATLLAAPAFAYGDPASGATTGVHFARVLNRIGVADEVKRKALTRNGGIDVMREVAAGRAAFGVTQTSEIVAAPGCRVAAYLPDAVQLVTTYAAAPTKAAKSPATAKAFVAFMTSAAGAATFAGQGFERAR
jgi:molybdate transport system substrate-binding protein